MSENNCLRKIVGEIDIAMPRMVININLLLICCNLCIAFELTVVHLCTTHRFKLIRFESYEL